LLFFTDCCDIKSNAYSPHNQRSWINIVHFFSMQANDRLVTCVNTSVKIVKIIKNNDKDIQKTMSDCIIKSMY